MIDHEVTAAFPPIWMQETGDGEVFWPWLVASPTVTAAEMLIGFYGEAERLTLEPNANGSRLIVTDAGLILHLAQQDKARFIGRPTVFAGRVVANGVTDEVAGSLIVSDWACRPHEGNA